MRATVTNPTRKKTTRKKATRKVVRKKTAAKKAARKNPTKKVSPKQKKRLTATKKAKGRKARGYRHRPVVYTDSPYSESAYSRGRRSPYAIYNTGGNSMAKRKRRRRVTRRRPAARRRYRRVRRNPSNGFTDVMINSLIAGASGAGFLALVKFISNAMSITSAQTRNIIKLVATVGLAWMLPQYMPKDRAEAIVYGAGTATVLSVLRTSFDPDGKFISLGQDDIDSEVEALINRLDGVAPLQLDEDVSNLDLSGVFADEGNIDLLGIVTDDEYDGYY